MSANKTRRQPTLCQGPGVDIFPSHTVFLRDWLCKWNTTIRIFCHFKILFWGILYTPAIGETVEFSSDLSLLITFEFQISLLQSLHRVLRFCHIKLVTIVMMVAAWAMSLGSTTRQRAETPRRPPKTRAKLENKWLLKDLTTTNFQTPH